jgi:CO/xanthine dehydrogenase FAD-binding subunit
MWNGPAPGAVKQVSGEARARFLAGGTNLVDFMRLNVEAPTLLVDINPLPLDKIEVSDAGVWVGAMVRNSDAAKAALQGARPQKFNAFKVELARRAVVRALTVVGGMT